MKTNKQRLIVMLSLLVVVVVTFTFVNNNPKKPITVGVLPFENFPSAYTDSVCCVIEERYNFTVVKLDAHTLPEECFINVKSPRYRADKLLKYLLKVKPDTIDIILGLTNKDISTTKKDALGRVKKPASKYQDWGIFGLGYRPGDACIVSTYRLSKPGLTIDRLRKIVTHEIGHNLGLKHCKEDKHCVMDDAAESIKTIDSGGIELCERCTGLIGN
jgi:archaemetzincin